MAGRKRGVFIVGLVIGALVACLFATRQGKDLRARLTRAAESGAAPDWQGDGAGDDARSEALRQKIEETRRRLREQVGLPPEG